MDRFEMGRSLRGVESSTTSLARWAARVALGVAWGGLLLVGSAGDGFAQGTGTIVGRVVDAASGEPIASAQISIVGTSLHSVTAAGGWYLIPRVPEGTHEVSATADEYSTITKKVKIEAGGGAAVDFSLHSPVVALDELVIANTMGGEKRRELGNSLASMQGDQLERQSSGVRLGTALQGQIAGLQVLSGGGQAGAGKILRLRGINSLVNQEPLVFLDGIRLGRISQASPGGTGQVISALDMLNPQDVARIEVLRGSAATALYGSDGAGGVILIYTR
jgi:TonB-dependent SusC/RagA subfamily outer membrane receptor